MIRQSEFQCTQQQEIQIKEKQTHLTLSLSSAITTIAELICEFLTLLKYQLLELLQSSQNSKTTIRPRAMASYLAQQRSTSNLWREYSQSSVKISPNFELKVRFSFFNFFEIISSYIILGNLIERINCSHHKS